MSQSPAWSRPRPPGHRSGPPFALATRAPYGIFWSVITAVCLLFFLMALSFGTAFAGLLTAALVLVTGQYAVRIWAGKVRHLRAFIILG